LTVWEAKSGYIATSDGPLLTDDGTRRKKIRAFEGLPKGGPFPHRRENPKIFLKDILANGPVPATLVEERGAAHGFTNGFLENSTQLAAI
jgi:hypothetical protein